MSKTVLITGASSGFGNLTAKKFQSEGWNVVATMRSPEKEQELIHLENVLVTKLDVTDTASIENAVSETIGKFGSLDVLVNNAGIGSNGLLEQLPEQQLLNMFETNVFGPIRVCQAVLPVMRQRKNGTIINVTSAAGYFGMPLYSAYCASKYAMEGLTESMALEYKPLNIAVKAVAPGGYGTNFDASTNNNLENGDEELRNLSQKIAAQSAATSAQMQQQSGSESNPQEVADKIYECATTDAPVHNLCGTDAEWVIGMANSMPRQDFVQRLEEMMISKD